MLKPAGDRRSSKVDHHCEHSAIQGLLGPFYDNYTVRAASRLRNICSIGRFLNYLKRDRPWYNRDIMVSRFLLLLLLLLEPSIPFLTSFCIFFFTFSFFFRFFPFLSFPFLFFFFSFFFLFFPSLFFFFLPRYLLPLFISFFIYFFLHPRLSLSHKRRPFEREIEREREREERIARAAPQFSISMNFPYPCSILSI